MVAESPPGSSCSPRPLATWKSRKSDFTAPKPCNRFGTNLSRCDRVRPSRRRNAVSLSMSERISPPRSDDLLLQLKNQSRTSSKDSAAQIASHSRRVAALDATAAEIRSARSQAEQKKSTSTSLLAELRPFADALKEKRWYSPAFWKARSDKTLANRLADAESQLSSAAAALDELAKHEQKLAAERQRAEQENDVELNKWLESEIARRKCELDASEAELEREAKVDASREQQLSAELGQAAADHNAGRTIAEGELAEARHEFERARSHSTEVSATIDSLVMLACQEASIVAGPIADLATDRELQAGRAFDLVVIDNAHRMNEGDFLAALRLASRCVLIGEPSAVGSGRSRVQQPDLFARLASALRHEVWVQDGDKLVCRLHSVRGADRKRLECEPVADSPEIELRVFAPAEVEPALAEVAFPISFDPAVAREFLFREMGEITCQPSGRTPRWETPDGKLVARFASSDTGNQYATIGEGIREELCGLETRAIHFESNWSSDDARAWLEEHVGQRDPGRTDLPAQIVSSLPRSCAMAQSRLLGRLQRSAGRKWPTRRVPRGSGPRPTAASRTQRQAATRRRRWLRDRPGRSEAACGAARRFQRPTGPRLRQRARGTGTRSLFGSRAVTAWPSLRHSRPK